MKIHAYANSGQLEVVDTAVAGRGDPLAVRVVLRDAHHRHDSRVRVEVVAARLALQVGGRPDGAGEREAGGLQVACFLWILVAVVAALWDQTNFTNIRGSINFLLESWITRILDYKEKNSLRASTY